MARIKSNWISSFLGQLAVVVLLALLFVCGGVYKYHRAGELTAGILLIPVCVAVLLVLLVAGWWWLRPSRPSRPGVWQWFWNKRWLWGLLVLTVLLRLPTWGTAPQDDGMEYYTALYNACSNFRFDPLYIFQNFRLANHPTWGMALLAAIPEFFMPGNYNSFWVLHTGLAMAASAGVYDLLLRQSGKRTVAFLGALTVGSTPIFLGLTPHISVEPALGAFFLCLVWAYSREYSLLTVFTCGLTALSKELGIVLVAGFVGGVFLSELWANRACGLLGAVRRMLSKPVNAILGGLCLVGGVFVLWYLFDPNLGWYTRAVNSESNLLTIALDPAYTWEKVQEFLFTNFDWLLVLVCLACLAVRGLRKGPRTPLPSTLAGVLLAVLLFQCVSILAVTFTITRYNLAPEMALAFLAVSLVTLTLQGWGRGAVLAALAVAFAVQAYFTVDPVMKWLYPTIDTGAISMVRVKRDDRSRHMSHYVIYNNQYSYLYNGLREIFRAYAPQDNDLIILGTDGFIYLQGRLWDTSRQDYAAVYNNAVVPISSFETEVSYDTALEEQQLKEHAILLCSPTYADQTLTPEQARALIPGEYTNVEQHIQRCGPAGSIVYFTADLAAE